MAVIWLPKISSLRSRGPFAVCGDSARTSALRELVRDCRGVVAAEFLFLMFPLLLLLLGTFDIGLAMLTANRINFAVEAAAKCGAVGSAMCASPAETAAYGASIAGLPGLDASRFLVMPAACGMNVTATYPYAGVVVPVITLSAGACYPTG